MFYYVVGFENRAYLRKFSTVMKTTHTKYTFMYVYLYTIYQREKVILYDELSTIEDISLQIYI